MSDELSALPPDAVLVHIGPHQTGTTAIQTVLGTSRPALREHGVEYPGGPRERHHARPVNALRQLADGWAQDPEAPPEPKAWQEFAEQVRGTPGRVVISSEFLSLADATARAAVVGDLGPERVHIVAGARNPAAIAVSTWQQVLRKGHPLELEQWLEKFYRRDDVPKKPTGFWAHADPAALVEQWAEFVDRDRITVVVLDECDQRLLPTTFERLLCLPEGLLADQTPPQSNRALTAVEAALLRQVIASLDSQLSWAEYTRMIRSGVTQRVLKVRQPGPDEPQPTLPTWAAEQAVVEAERSITRLRESGARIVGNLDALRTVSTTVGEAPAFTHVPLDLAVQAAVGAIAAGTHSPSSVAARRKKTPVRAKPADVDSVPARELVAVLRHRVRAGLRRRLRRG